MSSYNRPHGGYSRLDRFQVDGLHPPMRRRSPRPSFVSSELAHLISWTVATVALVGLLMKAGGA